MRKFYLEQPRILDQVQSTAAPATMPWMTLPPPSAVCAAGGRGAEANDGTTMPVVNEIISPELVLVSPPELAAQARDALPDYEAEFEQWLVQIRSVSLRNPPSPANDPLGVDAIVFTIGAAMSCLAPLVLLLLLR